ncbi:MAG: zinc ABC transporter substrate-binding protein [Planctomycetales bacterium]|nr:zinc ABC transporter substrate-binding protein [Planctomycetales bacterium]
MATTGPVGDLVSHIVGKHAEVTTLMGPGVDPHLYREQPADITLLSRADVVFFNGLHLEGRMTDTLERLGKRRAVFAVTHELEQASDRGDLLIQPEGFGGIADPHVWHDVSLWMRCCGYVAKRMAEVDPEHSAEYDQAAKEYQDALGELHNWCKEQLATIPEERRVLITAHDAFAYFSRAYGLQAVGLKGVSTEDEIDLKHMSEVQQLIIQRKIPCVFVESAVAPQIMQALIEPCRAAGVEVTAPMEESHQLYADALGKPGSDADSYVGMIRANVNTIVAGLTGKLSSD